ncbi:MAG: hypothetical protein AAGA53_16330 [Pseudomonadota bacterium]
MAKRTLKIAARLREAMADRAFIARARAGVEHSETAVSANKSSSE